MTLSRRKLLAGGLAGAAAGVLAACVPLDRTDSGRLAAKLRLIEVTTGGVFGVAFFDPTSRYNLAHNGAERFAMASTFKASLAAMALAEGQAGRLDLEQVTRWSAADLVPYRPFAEERLDSGATWRELARAAQVLSDNTAANLLLARLGGPQALTRFWRENGDAISRQDRNEPDLNRVPPGDPRDTTTPIAMARTLHRLLFGTDGPLGTQRQAELRGWMTDTATGTKRVRAGLRNGWIAGDKTGNSGAWPDAPYTRGDIGFAVGQGDVPVTFAVYHRSPMEAPIDAARVDAGFADIGRMLNVWISTLRVTVSS